MRGAPRKERLDLPGFGEVKRAAFLPRKLAQYLCEEGWSPEIAKIVGGKRPKVFELGTVDTDTVAKCIRKVAKDTPGFRMIWPDGRR